MNVAMLSYEKELAIRIGEVAHYKWDPICIAGDPLAREEYGDYVPMLCSLAKSGDLQALLKYIENIETNLMGLKYNADNAEKAAEIMIEWSRCLRERYKL